MDEELGRTRPDAHGGQHGAAAGDACQWLVAVVMAAPVGDIVCHTDEDGDTVCNNTGGSTHEPRPGAAATGRAVRTPPSSTTTDDLPNDDHPLHTSDDAYSPPSTHYEPPPTTRDEPPPTAPPTAPPTTLGNFVTPTTRRAAHAGPRAANPELPAGAGARGRGTAHLRAHRPALGGPDRGERPTSSRNTRHDQDRFQRRGERRAAGRRRRRRVGRSRAGPDVADRREGEHVARPARRSPRRPRRSRIRRRRRCPHRCWPRATCRRM